MKPVLVLGAGKIGSLISGLLAESNDYEVQLADARDGAAAEVSDAHGLTNIRPFNLDASDAAALTAHVQAEKPIAAVSQIPVRARTMSSRRSGNRPNNAARHSMLTNKPRPQEPSHEPPQEPVSE